jgi:alanine racemase
VSDLRAVADIDLDALTHNVHVLAAIAAPAELWCVVKANAYGHGVTFVGPTCVAAGARGLCVATTSEAVELRRHLPDTPILILSEQPPSDAPDIAAAGVLATVYTKPYTDALAAAATSVGHTIGVHVKVDTGMHRVGVDPDDLDDLLAHIARTPCLRVDAVFTHLANADVPDDPYNDRQLDLFDVATAHLDLAKHAANSAAIVALKRARERDLVRAGIAIYGVAPGPAVADLTAPLVPVMSLRSRVAFVKRLSAGSEMSYGLRGRVDRESTIASIPIGYADGVPRRLSAGGGEVLIRGRRFPMIGTVTMDQLLVNCGDDTVEPGDEVVLFGDQLDERITVDEVADRCGTIAYEILCGISARVPRRYRLPGQRIA